MRILDFGGRGKFKEIVVGIEVVYDTDRHLGSVSSEKWSYYGYFIAVTPFLPATFLDIAVSRDFCVFCILEAARGRFKEVLVGIKVVHGTYTRFRRVLYEKWSYNGYFIAVKPFQTAIFLDIAVSRNLCVFRRSLYANPKR